MGSCPCRQPVRKQTRGSPKKPLKSLPLYAHVQRMHCCGKQTMCVCLSVVCIGAYLHTHMCGSGERAACLPGACLPALITSLPTPPSFLPCIEGILPISNEPTQVTASCKLRTPPLPAGRASLPSWLHTCLLRTYPPNRNHPDRPPIRGNSGETRLTSAPLRASSFPGHGRVGR